MLILTNFEILSRGKIIFKKYKNVALSVDLYTCRNSRFRAEGQWRSPLVEELQICRHAGTLSLAPKAN